jgi:hypothetical protein
LSVNRWCAEALADAADLEELSERDDVEAQERFERARRAWWSRPVGEVAL